MIEIKLTGDDALNYLRNESLKDSQIAAFMQQEDTSSPRVLADTEALDDLIETAEEIIQTKPKFVSLKGVPYTDENIALIHARMKKLATNQDRSLKSIAGALGRSSKAVASKLNSMGIRVNKGMCYYKD